MPAFFKLLLTHDSFIIHYSEAARAPSFSAFAGLRYPSRGPWPAGAMRTPTCFHNSNALPIRMICNRFSVQNLRPLIHCH